MKRYSKKARPLWGKRLRKRAPVHGEACGIEVVGRRKLPVGATIQSITVVDPGVVCQPTNFTFGVLS